MKALILVMSAQRPPWGTLLNTSRETWDSVEHPQTQTIYYCGSDVGTHRGIRNIFFSERDESLPNLTKRTQEAFERAAAMPDWDFVARVNSSCYVHKANLVKHLQFLPTEGVLQGLLTFDGGGASLLWGGGQYVMSRDVVEKLASSPMLWRKYSQLMEDQAITRVAEDAGVVATPGRCCSIDDLKEGRWRCVNYGGESNFEFTDFADVPVKAEGHYFFRVKQDHNRALDVMLMRKLKEVLP